MAEMTPEQRRAQAAAQRSQKSARQTTAAAQRKRQNLAATGRQRQNAATKSVTPTGSTTAGGTWLPSPTRPMPTAPTSAGAPGGAAYPGAPSRMGAKTGNKPMSAAERQSQIARRSDARERREAGEDPLTKRKAIAARINTRKASNEAARTAGLSDRVLANRETSQPSNRMERAAQDQRRTLAKGARYAEDPDAWARSRRREMMGRRREDRMDNASDAAADQTKKAASAAVMSSQERRGVAGDAYGAGAYKQGGVIKKKERASKTVARTRVKAKAAPKAKPPAWFDKQTKSVKGRTK